MKKQEILSQALPKWPALIVWGNPVSRDQAKEILIRTCGLEYFSTNDTDFKKELFEFIYDVEVGFGEYVSFLSDAVEGGWEESQKMADEVIIKTGNFYDNLGYLGNEQICSSWIGGAHGWCGWNGHIGTNNYNIGKWPSGEEVLHDWEIIAKAFPFLDLTCQLLSGETCEDNLEAVIQYRIKDGKVRVSKPNKVKLFPKGADFSHFLTDGWERGCSVENFKKAYNFVIENKS